VAYAPRECNHLILALATEKISNVFPNRTWAREENYVVFLAGGNDIVVEMVNDQICALRGEMDVEFEKERG
jgi:hypothetical protein